MGPHPLWLLEDLHHDVMLNESMRVLGLGCGKGATSVFLALEFEVEVWAVDLWIDRSHRETVFRTPKSVTGCTPSRRMCAGSPSRMASST